MFFIKIGHEIFHKILYVVAIIVHLWAWCIYIPHKPPRGEILLTLWQCRDKRAFGLIECDGGSMHRDRPSSNKLWSDQSNKVSNFFQAKAKSKNDNKSVIKWNDKKHMRNIFALHHTHWSMDLLIMVNEINWKRNELINKSSNEWVCNHLIRDFNWHAT